MSAWLHQPPAAVDGAMQEAALARQRVLTKPPGSLGRVEEIAVRLAAQQRTSAPSAHRVCITVFAADHGVAEEGVSAFPQTVTVQMLRNFASGGAAISVLARALDATLHVVDVGTAVDPGPLPGIRRRRAGPGTKNFTSQPAMSERELGLAMDAGREAADLAAPLADVAVFGEMGIANTTSATALACVLLNASPAELTGSGTGLTRDGVARKQAVIERALRRHRDSVDSPLQALHHLGGFEIAALAGAYVRCAQIGLPVLVDGFIATAAAVAAVRIAPAARAWMWLTHLSAEPGHAHVAGEIGGTPLLDLRMRLGEGTGAAMCVPLLRLACALHNGMATFSEAGIGTAP